MLLPALRRVEHPLSETGCRRRQKPANEAREAQAKNDKPFGRGAPLATDACDAHTGFRVCTLIQR